MARKHLSLVIGMLLMGKRLPAQDDQIGWERLHYANRAPAAARALFG